MRFTRASLLGIILLAVASLPIPVQARTASGRARRRGRVRSASLPWRPSPQRDGTAVRRLRGSGQDATRRRGVPASPPRAGHGHVGTRRVLRPRRVRLPVLPLLGLPLLRLSLLRLPVWLVGRVLPVRWFWCELRLGATAGLRRGYAEPVPVPYDSAEPAPEGQAYLGLGRDGRDPQARVRPPGRRGRRLRQGLERRLGSSVHPLRIACPGVLAGGVPDAAGTPRCPAGPRLPRPPGAAAGGGSRSPFAPAPETSPPPPRAAASPWASSS